MKNASSVDVFNSLKMSPNSTQKLARVYEMFSFIILSGAEIMDVLETASTEH